MFSELGGEYKAQVIRHWRRYLNDKLMIIDAPLENKVVLANDPHEARFFIDESVDGVSLDLGSTTQTLESTTPTLGSSTPTLGSSTPKLPASGEISGYVTFYTRNL